MRFDELHHFAALLAMWFPPRYPRGNSFAKSSGKAYVQYIEQSANSLTTTHSPSFEVQILIISSALLSARASDELLLSEIYFSKFRDPIYYEQVYPKIWRIIC